jgi:hypothetical protein
MGCHAKLYSISNNEFVYERALEAIDSRVRVDSKSLNPIKRWKAKREINMILERCLTTRFHNDEEFLKWLVELDKE